MQIEIKTDNSGMESKVINLTLCAILGVIFSSEFLLVVLSAFLFPVPLTALMTMPQTAGQNVGKIDIFNDYFQFVIVYKQRCL